ncbi:NACHT, LRR and PYD domains-containing protein 1 homolog [Mugil cephalus]|uniref:NACHT, LRR and PYD domains-containing protein 1 homolog n=1 Tax=Mugil cephalus TaxID=48193 RepID=UPI001FB7EEBA|nr:NACHT, LRR and PYD domains-containing protein 1 homolog [Mugil cephalus]
MEKMEHIHYMPAGPLMDVTVMTGTLKEVYLPHLICIDDIPDILNQFAVLHINDCGDEVEEVSEVTASHVKLKEPIFSPRGVLMRADLPVKINCNVLIYQTNTAFLTLHVYLIPRDDGLKQAITQEKLSEGCKEIRKTKPEKSLKFRNRFLLTADVDGAEIYPEEGLKLRYDTDPNFFEVYIKNPNRDFHLKLTKRNELQSVWMCPVREENLSDPFRPARCSSCLPCCLFFR